MGQLEWKGGDAWAHQRVAAHIDQAPWLRDPMGSQQWGPAEPEHCGISSTVTNDVLLPERGVDTAIENWLPEGIEQMPRHEGLEVAQLWPLGTAPKKNAPLRRGGCSPLHPAVP